MGTSLRLLFHFFAKVINNYSNSNNLYSKNFNVYSRFFDMFFRSKFCMYYEETLR